MRSYSHAEPGLLFSRHGFMTLHGKNVCDIGWVQAIHFGFNFLDYTVRMGPLLRIWSQHAWAISQCGEYQFLYCGYLCACSLHAGNGHVVYTCSSTISRIYVHVIDWQIEEFLSPPLFTHVYVHMYMLLFIKVCGCCDVFCIIFRSCCCFMSEGTIKSAGRDSERKKWTSFPLSNIFM